jgi:hypothetical protein
MSNSHESAGRPLQRPQANATPTATTNKEETARTAGGDQVDDQSAKPPRIDSTT